MIAGAIPGLSVILYDAAQRNRNPSVGISFLALFYIIIPSILAGAAGLLLGGDILDLRKQISAGQAAVRGLCVALVTWLAFVPILSVVAGKNLNANLLYRAFLILLFGSAVVGWLIAIIGIATGLLLHRMGRAQT